MLVREKFSRDSNANAITASLDLFSFSSVFRMPPGIIHKGLCRTFRSDQHFVGNGFGYKADGE
jgi:hypothetical protein